MTRAVPGAVCAVCRQATPGLMPLPDLGDAHSDCVTALFDLEASGMTFEEAERFVRTLARSPDAVSLYRRAEGADRWSYVESGEVGAIVWRLQRETGGLGFDVAEWQVIESLQEDGRFIRQTAANDAAYMIVGPGGTA